MMGKPTIIIQDGKIIKKNMTKVRLDINELLEECRIKGYFDISQISFGIMEVNGEMSFMPKADYKPLTIKDLNLYSNPNLLYANIIIDGKIMYKHLKLINKDYDWLIKKLKSIGYNDIKNILLCIADLDGNLKVFESNDSIQSLDILE